MEHSREYPGEYPVVLSQILSELKSKHQNASHPELCRWLCSRFELVHLAKLRSLLFHTASLDPSFPASLFRDQMCCSSPDPHSKKLQLAVDVVSIFSLIQNGSPAKQRLPIARAPLHKNHSVGGSDCHTHPLPSSVQSTKAVADSHHFIPATEPNFLLRVNKDLKCRAASLDKLHPLPLYGPETLGRSCEMQSTYFPMEADSEPSTEQESLSQPGSQPKPPSIHSCVHKRNIFKEDFHNMSAFSPKVIRQASESIEGTHQRELQRPVVFFNHSFELPCTNPYMEPGLNSPLEERQRAKHESLDDLQASTYFGPSTISESVSTQRFTDRVSEGTHIVGTKPTRPTRPVKSFSLNTEYVPAPIARPITNKRPLRNTACMNGDRESTKAASAALSKKGQALPPLTNGPEYMERKDEEPWFDSRSASRGFQRGESCSNVSTQTEQSNKPKRLKSFSRSDSEMISDDISDIFRFLDDMSVCDSLTMVQSCYNSNGSLSQLTLRSDADSSPERSTVRLAKSRLDSLFHSLDNSDDELKANVHRLVRRIGEIEKKLESLSGVRSEITQLLSKLNQLDHKVHKPEHSEGNDTALSDTSPCPQTFQCPTTGHSTGQTSGHPSEHTSGHITGHVIGHPSGHTSGHITGHVNGHANAHPHGNSSGHANGHTSGHSGGHASGPSNGHSGGHPSGHSGGPSTGHSGGHSSGHSGGHSGGHSVGHSGGKTGGHTIGLNTGHSRTLVDWSSPPAVWSSTVESLGVKALKNSLLRRSSRSLNQEPSQDWSTAVYCTERPRISREMQHDLSRAGRAPADFPPQPYTPSLKQHLQNTPVYTDMDPPVKSSPVYSELRLDSTRLHPSWSGAEGYTRHPEQRTKQHKSLDIQGGSALDPSHLDYWLEDVYTPGFDSLLRRKQADLRRARACKLAALIAAATCTLLLVIVVPIVTMRT